MGCILPTMHRRSRHCWELLHPLHTTANTHGTTPNIVGATMFNNVGSCCVRLHAALKTEFALLQTLSRLFLLVYFVKCWQMLLRLNSKGLYQSSGKEKERWFFRGNTTQAWAFTAFNKDVGKINQSSASYKHKNLMRSVIYLLTLKWTKQRSVVITYFTCSRFARCCEEVFSAFVQGSLFLK